MRRPGAYTNHSAARPRKAKKPTQSVIMVTNTPEAMAGSRPQRIEAERNEDARQRRDQEIDDHGRADHQAELAAAEPVEGDRPHDQREHEPVEQADDGLAADDPRGVDRAELLRGERAHRHGHGLRAGIAAHRGDDRHQHGKRHHLLDGGVEQADHLGGEDGGAEIDEQPEEAVLGGLPAPDRTPIRRRRRPAAGCPPKPLPG